MESKVIFTPSVFAFRFAYKDDRFAVDIVDGKLLFAEDKADGWRLLINDLPASEKDIINAGGIVDFVYKIIEAVNAKLIEIFGGKRDLPPSDTLKNGVLKQLSKTVVVRENMEGIPQLRFA